VIAVVAGCAALSVVAAWGVLRPWMRPGGEVVAGGPACSGASARVRVGGRFSRAVLAGAIVTLAAITAPFLVGSLGGSPETAAPPDGSMGALVQRVGDAPDDVAARLDLAAAYLAGGDAASAATQYENVLRQDPANAEAHARLAWVLLGAARPRAALAETARALETRPGDPEALYVRGVTLGRLGRTAQAARTFRAYLRAAPFGAYRAQARGFLHSDRQEVPARG
jgi:tetratricopeptide (TPR) repeat protein